MNFQSAFLTLVPHDNVLFAIALEQRELCAHFKLFPAYPLFCPLAPLGTGADGKAILTKYRKIFQSFGQQPQLAPPEFDAQSGVLYRALQVLPPELLEGLRRDFGASFPQELSAQFGFMRFCYGTIRNPRSPAAAGFAGAAQAAESSAQAAATAGGDPANGALGKYKTIGMRVFKLAIMQLELQRAQAENAGLAPRPSASPWRGADSAQASALLWRQIAEAWVKICG